MANDEKIARDGKSGNRLGGRLIAVSHQVDPLKQNVNAFGDDLAIDFPSMPDTIDLVRSTDYYTSSPPPLPDGLHLYRGTKPLDIPFSFKLHAFDDNYCPEGALTLLKIAARLHAFVLPLSTEPSLVVRFTGEEAPTPANEDNKPANGKKTIDELNHDAQGNPDWEVVSDKGAAFYPPVVAWLHLMWVSEDKPGISCLGYVREVAVKFHGPWLRGPDNSFNLPSMAEYSFTFVHRPGHTNGMRITTTVGKPNIGRQSSATAEDVKDRLYSTYNLIAAQSAVGFGDELKASSPPPRVVPPLVPPTTPIVILPTPAFPDVRAGVWNVRTSPVP